MKTKITQFCPLWVLLILPLTAVTCKDKSATPPKDNLNAGYSCYKKYIDKEEKNFLGYFSNVFGWIEKTPEEYLSKVSQPFVLIVAEDAIIPPPPDGINLLMAWTIPVFHCAGKVFSKSDYGKRATISGRFFYKDCKGEKLLFYDEGEGNPPFTYFNKLN